MTSGTTELSVNDLTSLAAAVRDGVLFKDYRSTNRCRGLGCVSAMLKRLACGIIELSFFSIIHRTVFGTVLAYVAFWP